MIIKCTECEAIAGNNLILDMANAADKRGIISIATWLQNVLLGEAEFVPLDCAVKFNGKWYGIINSGKIADDAQDICKKIRKLPHSTLPSDSIRINADVFEQELYINLDGK